MAYRSGTYVAFYAEGKTEPDETDMKYYNLLQAWDKNKAFDFSFVNSHEKASAVRDTSKKITLENTLKERLRNSKNMILVIGKTTRLDRDWVPMEIEYAVENCKITIIAAYPGYLNIRAPQQLSLLWPTALKERIENNTAHVIHIPFREKPIIDAISQFDYNKFPNGGGLGHYNDDAYRSWGLLT
ncbi:MAG: TIR domain-containing protein [Candidatus Omnitrophota bacterium]|jgi:hypothetical protein|nr:TIR domain-containing protein [Candidatus Omnitrophota bacterium]